MKTLYGILLITVQYALSEANFNCTKPPIAVTQFPHINACCRSPRIDLGDAPKKCETFINSLNDENWDFPAFAHVCYPACIYRETGAMVDDVIQLETVENFLKLHVHQQDSEMVPHILKAFETCFNSIKEHLTAAGLEKYAALPIGCSPYASMVYGCVNAETFLNCPADFWANGTATVACDTARAFARQCNPLPHVPLPQT